LTVVGSDLYKMFYEWLRNSFLSLQYLFGIETIETINSSNE